MEIILGIDPGSRLTGVGVLKVDRDSITHIFHGVIDASKEATFHRRIVKIGQELSLVLDRFTPSVVVIEQMFLGKNADSAFKLGHARGICMYEALKRGLPVSEYATRYVKKGVTGSGAADKIQVHRALETLLQTTIQNPMDASDALAMAYHHAIQMEITRKMNRMVGGLR